jgi:hypothetical protein
MIEVSTKRIGPSGAAIERADGQRREDFRRPCVRQPDDTQFSRQTGRTMLDSVHKADMHGAHTLLATRIISVTSRANFFASCASFGAAISFPDNRYGIIAFRKCERMLNI